MNIEKKNAALGALHFIKPGMIIGLGTGTTAAEFIKLLAEEIKNGLKVSCVATSIGSERLAESLFIPLHPLTNVSKIDIAVDGADVITKKALLKGGGGALTREKVVDYEAKKFIVIADESKIKKQLEGQVVVEVLPFAYSIVLKQLQLFSKHAKLRIEKGEPVITDNGNYLIDCQMLVQQPKKIEHELNQIPGVVENGIFTKFHRVIIGKKDGYEFWV